MANKNTSIKGYKIDFENNTLTMNYTFASAAGIYGTPENKLLMQIQKDFPKLTIIKKSGRDQKTPKKNKRLTYDNMKKHLSVYDNSAELLAEFEEVKVASLSSKSPYKFVTDWFKAQCPDYANAQIFKNTKLDVVKTSKAS